MGERRITIIGIGGRTGTMFANHLRDSGEILGIGRREEVELIKREKVFIKKNEKEEIFKEKVIEVSEFPNQFSTEVLFLTTKNPVGPVVKFYYQKIRERGLIPPILLLSQNGISAGEEAITVLKEIFGKEAEKIQVIRISLFNPIDRKIINGKIYIVYSLPIRMAISRIFGPRDITEIVELFRKSGCEISEVPTEKAKNMEFSKLFLNLIGMAAASRGMSFDEGFKNSEVFQEEIESLKEYIRIVKANGGDFLNFPHYSVKILSSLIDFSPVQLLLLFKAYLGKLITKGRSGKLKDLDEIDYYNGAVINLGKKMGISTPINEKIIQRIKK